MHRRAIYYLIACCCIVLFRPAAAVTVLKFDSAIVNTIRPPAEKEREVFSAVDLGLAKTGESHERNPVARFFAWLMEKIFGNTSERGMTTLRWSIIWLLIAGGVALLVWLFRKGDFGTMLTGNAKRSEFGFSDVEEDISGIDFEARIRNAIREQQFRAAIRWMYLKQLHLLHETARISWQAHKTNIDYIHELSTSPLKKQFQEISRIYEYAWYGDYPITEKVFRHAEAEFVQFEQQLYV